LEIFDNKSLILPCIEGDLNEPTKKKFFTNYSSDNHCHDPW